MRLELWRLQARRSVVKCVVENENRAELVLLQDEEVAHREQFCDEYSARHRAEALRARLVAGGWRDAS